MDVPVYNMDGEQTGSIQVDESLLGDHVRYDLLKQAIVMWQLNQRQGSARTKSRGMIVGSTRKLYRQKGTGNARMGNVRTPIRRGGGVTFAKQQQRIRREMPRKMKQSARNSALLAKLKAGGVIVVDPLAFDEIKTKTFVEMLRKLDADRGCVVVLDAPNEAVYRSGRNIPRTEIRQVYDLNAYEILLRRKVIFTRQALANVMACPSTYRPQAVESVTA
jgi:large subunit ribosomal protein L4